MGWPTRDMRMTLTFRFESAPLSPHLSPLVMKKKRAGLLPRSSFNSQLKVRRLWSEEADRELIRQYGRVSLSA